MSSTEATWRNWSGRLASYGELRHVRSEADAVAVAADGGASGRTLRVAGAGHSHMPLIPNDHVVVDSSGLAGVISTDLSTRRAWVWAGTSIAALGQPLQTAGLALVNQGDIDRQAIAGASATGTHGTGRELGNLSSAVVGARIALASGDLVECGPDHNVELFDVARLNLGALGIVTRLELQLRESFKLREVGTVRPFDEVIVELADIVNRSRHYEFFWLPQQDVCVEKAISETDDPAEYPIAREGRRVGWNYEVLPSHRDWRHTEMEYSVPLERGPACLAEIREMVLTRFPTMPWAVEYRTLAADDVWMSTAYRRETVTISLHQAVDEDEEPMFRAAEQIFRSFDGRPHWAKVNYLTGADLAELHERWADWWRVRDQHDPNEVFLNDYLSSIRP